MLQFEKVVGGFSDDEASSIKEMKVLLSDNRILLSVAASELITKLTCTEIKYPA